MKILRQVGHSCHFMMILSNHNIQNWKVYYFETWHEASGKGALHNLYTEQKKKRNNRPPRIFEFKFKALIISGLLLFDSHSWDIRVYHAKD